LIHKREDFSSSLTGAGVGVGVGLTSCTLNVKGKKKINTKDAKGSNEKRGKGEEFTSVYFLVYLVDFPAY
jgi:hypothetical protein